MAKLLIPALLCLALYAGSCAAAEDGLVVQFEISEQAIGSSTRSSLNSSVLMRFNEEVSFEIGDQYVLKIGSRRNGPDSVSLLVSLKDIIDGKPYYVGASATEIRIGEQSELNLENYDTNYTISLDTAYGKLPES